MTTRNKKGLIIVGISLFILGGFIAFIFWKRKRDTELYIRSVDLIGESMAKIDAQIKAQQALLKAEEESGFKWPTWLKIGGCRPCAGSIHDGCCNGCVCKDKAMIKQ